MHFQEEGWNFFLTKVDKIWYHYINIDKGVNIFLYLRLFLLLHNFTW